ncbi:CgeB family protein [Pseudomonas sp. S1_G07]
MKYLLDGKKVLVVAPQFFGYETEICDELKRRGAKVDFLLDRPFASPLMKAVTRLRRQWVIKAADRYYTHQMEQIKSSEYDYIFVVNGQTLSTTILECWQKMFPSAVFVLYMWDSFGNRRWVLENLKYFHHVFTFDRNDAAKYGLNFRALFFSRGFEVVAPVQAEFDISFIGTAHTDRYQVLKKVDKALGPSINKHWYLFLQAKWVYLTYKLTNRGFKGASISDFKYDPLDKGTVQRVFFL